jgi:hypothetical protein
MTDAPSSESVPADQVKAGDHIRLASGVELVVARVETGFLGRPEMVAFIQDAPQPWFKAVSPLSGSVELLA